MSLNILKQPDKFSDSGKGNSPADKARAVYDERIGSIAVQNYNWRRIAIFLGICCIVLSIGLTVQSLKSEVVPYVVTVDKTTGEVEKAGSLVASAQEYTPSEAEIRYFLAQFIQNSRSIQLDPVQQNKLQQKAYSYLTTQAAKKFKTIQDNEHFFDRYATVTVQTKIRSIKPISGTDSYHIAWDEDEFTISSGQQKTQKYEGVFSYKMVPPKDEMTRLNNPLGFYITDINFAPEIGQGQQNASGQKPEEKK